MGSFFFPTRVCAGSKNGAQQSGLHKAPLGALAQLLGSFLPAGNNTGFVHFSLTAHSIKYAGGFMVQSLARFESDRG
jgi:hypothetical protein